MLSIQDTSDKNKDFSEVQKIDKFVHFLFS